ncbi:iron uptake porin [Cyanobium sp. WAJ14-Wanaka]|uniref:iron uptake porin n=1 Tax=Cyanobium sp. WAJ14-Wanaka TaxID=2823725 RepID=UPI0020CFA697|nr:iron uptake porin [Cyanobium sp. WAJ14-Wanaka]MCP9775310.1 carbohydrate porin [Cyanobium sp. WAJ14-Wanaka]
MKLFKQLLVAPAALGLLAPMAANAADLNVAGVSKYAADEQVTSISQFSDVKPTDWAYQALSNLIERYGCVAGYPNGTYKGGQAMTRFEAAALLNACLDRVTETTDELKKLMTEFQKELAILKGRVDGLDARVGTLEANQFSTTTKLKGVATFVIGGVDNGTAYGVDYPTGSSTNNITFNYDVKLNLDTSFTGKDLLRTTLRSNNYQNSAFGQNGSAALETASTPSNTSADAVGINRLFYQFPVGSNWTATVGAKVRQDDMLAMWPSAYGADTILDRMTYAGAPGAYSLNLGAGAGLSYKKDGFSLSGNYVSNQLTSGNSVQSSNVLDADGSGIGSASTTTFQAGYAASNWGMAFAYTYSNAASSYALLDPNASYNSKGANNLGFSAYWQPKTTGIIPSISAGVGSTYANGDNGDSSTWQVALQWSDAFVKGNAFGMAYGDTQIGGTDQATDSFEVFYKMQVTDNISVTPAFVWINGYGGSKDSVGGLVKTTFKF